MRFEKTRYTSTETPEWLWRARVVAAASMARRWEDNQGLNPVSLGLGAGRIFCCGSPLEELFVLRLLSSGFWKPFRLEDPEFDQHADTFRANFGETSAWLLAATANKLPVIAWPQAEVFQDRRRADFAFFGGDCRDEFRIVVELDGFTFHERTAEQAARDRARDRELQVDQDWDVLRFLSTELIADSARSAVDQIHTLMLKRCVLAVSP